MENSTTGGSAGSTYGNGAFRGGGGTNDPKYEHSCNEEHKYYIRREQSDCSSREREEHLQRDYCFHTKTMTRLRSSGHFEGPSFLVGRMFTYEIMHNEDGQHVSTDTKEPPDPESKMVEDPMAEVTSPSGGSGSSISSEDLESCRTIDSDPAAILPCSDLSGDLSINGRDLSASTSDVKSQEVAPKNTDTPPNDHPYRVPPPDLPLHPPAAPVPVTDDLRQLFVTEENVREAFMKYAKGKLFYGTAPAAQMTSLHLSPLNIFKYTLETFAESRFCNWNKEPYYGGEVDGPKNGHPPYPWDIAVEPPELFTPGLYRTRVPHTSLVEICYICHGSGEMDCPYCDGRGRRVCIGCGGLGRVGGNMCLSCGGRGSSLCFICSGRGQKTCELCLGNKQLLECVMLNVSWEVFTTSEVTGQETGIPEKKLKNVTGKPIFREERVVIPPIKDFPEASVSQTSQKIMSEHLACVTSCRILGQRQTLELLPVTKVDFTWKMKQSDFFVFGNENMVYTGSYPQKCCCSIM